MIALDDEIWKEIDKSGQLPKQVALLKENFNHEVKDLLFYEELCLFYDVSPAAYPVIPHLIEIIASNEVAAQFEIVAFCGIVHACGGFKDLPDGRRIPLELGNLPVGQPVLEQINRDYFASIETLKPWCLKLLENQRLDWEDKKYVFFSLLGFSGQEGLSRLLLENSTLDEFELSCPACEKGLFLWPEENKMFAYKEEDLFTRIGDRYYSSSDKNAEKFYFSPAEIDWTDWNGEFSDEQKDKWIMFLIEKYELEPLRFIIPHLLSRMNCPYCQQSINILERLIEYNF